MLMRRSRRDSKGGRRLGVIIRSGEDSKLKRRGPGWRKHKVPRPLMGFFGASK